MRIKQINITKNQPISYDIIEIETIEGKKYWLCDCEIEQLLRDEGKIEKDEE